MTKQLSTQPEESDSTARRTVPALLIEATPPAHGLGHWALASPLILFLGWFWTDLFIYLSPMGRGVDLLLGMVLFGPLVLLPFGYFAHMTVTGLPGIFQRAGWDVRPLEPVRPAEQYTVRYAVRERERAPFDFSRLLLRVAQGWVYLEIAAIFVGAIAMVPLFFSAREFGFGG